MGGGGRWKEGGGRWDVEGGTCKRLEREGGGRERVVGREGGGREWEAGLVALFLDPPSWNCCMTFDLMRLLPPTGGAV